MLRERVRIWLEEAEGNNREIFEVLLATSEAFANAVEHPCQPRCHLVDVEASISDHTLTVSICDYGQWDGNQKREQAGQAASACR